MTDTRVKDGTIFLQPSRHSQIVYGAYKKLVCTILQRAVENWKAFGALESPCPSIKGSKTAFGVANEMCYGTPRIELLSFLQSDWCVFICDITEIDYHEMMEQIDAPLPFKSVWGVDK